MVEIGYEAESNISTDTCRYDGPRSTHKVCEIWDEVSVQQLLSIRATEVRYCAAAEVVDTYEIV